MWHVNQIDILYRISGFNCIYMYESIIDTSVDKCYNHHNLTCMICLWFFCNSIVYIVMKSLKRLRPGIGQAPSNWKTFQFPDLYHLINISFMRFVVQAQLIVTFCLSIAFPSLSLFAEALAVSSWEILNVSCLSRM